MKLINLLWFITMLITLTPNQAASPPSEVCARTVTEYLLPKSEQTHEIMYISGKNMLLITQFSNSKLLRVKTGPTGEITSVAAHRIGKSSSGLHGLAVSASYPGKFWVSLETDNKLILLTVKLSDIQAAPTVAKTIKVPSPGNGPHHIVEYGTNIWATLKQSEQVLRINHMKPTDYQLYKAQSTPVFLAQHPISKDIYASEYKTSSILRINPTKNTTSRIEVPPSIGESPVGLVSNGDFVWVALLSIKSKGTGSFGKIYSNGTVEWFKLKTEIGRRAALLHIAFDTDARTEAQPGVWFLGSSIEDPQAFDMIVRAHFDKDFEKFKGEEIVILPSQRIKAHRIAVSENGLYVTELTSSRVAFFTQTNNVTCDFSFQMVELSEDAEI